ncbi:hypothetical protein ABZU94_12535, partial [Streptomyces mirabilis]
PFYRRHAPGLLAREASVLTLLDPGVRPPGRRPLCRAMTLLLLPLDQDRDPRNEQRSSLNGRFSAKIPSPS